jgi:hypothetical protein
MQQCPLAENCIDYTTGDNRPPNHDVRNKVICAKWLSMECSAIPEIYMKLKGELPACNIEKMRRLKDETK